MKDESAAEVQGVHELMNELDAMDPAPGERTPEELNLAPQKLYEFITSDFESGWAAFAAMRPEHGRAGRGNMGYRKVTYNDLVLSLYPDALYLDIKAAFEASRLLERGLTLKYFSRAGEKQPTYQFNAESVEAALQKAGHMRLVAS